MGIVTKFHPIPPRLRLLSKTVPPELVLSRALSKAHGDRTQAAAALGVSVDTLARWMKRFNVTVEATVRVVPEPPEDDAECSS